MTLLLTNTSSAGGDVGDRQKVNREFKESHKDERDAKAKELLRIRELSGKAGLPHLDPHFALHALQVRKTVEGVLAHVEEDRKTFEQMGS